MIGGARWLTLARGISESFALLAAIALARLLTPAQFGHAAVALAFIPLAGILTFEGFASALVQHETITEDDRRAAVLMSLVGGMLLTLVVLALVPVFWRPVFGARTSALVTLVSPILLFAAIGGVPRATLWRNLEFRRVSIIDLIGLLVGSITAVGLAATGLGASALVIGGLAQIGSASLVMLCVAPSPPPGWSLQSLRRIAAFGVPAALAGAADVLFRNVDYLILAARLPAAATGIYYRAFNLGVVYQDKLSGVMVQVAYPVYSRTTSRDELRQLHERVARVHAAVIFPILACFVVTAPSLIPLVFGPAWNAAIGPAQILAIAGMLAAVLTGYAQVLLAVGRPRRLLAFNVARVIVYACAVTLAVDRGLTVVALTVVGVYALTLLSAYRFLLRPALGISIRGLVRDIGPAATGAAVLLAVTAPLASVTAHAVPAVPNIALLLLVGGGIYIVVLRGAFTGTWNDVCVLVGRVLPPLSRLQRRVPPLSVNAAAGRARS